MLAHCCVTYEMVYEDKHKKPNPLMKLIFKLLVKNVVVNEKSYKHNSQTAPAFKITDERQFDLEKNRLVSYITKTQQLGEEYFEGRESHSFGRLNKASGTNMFYKHLDHHLGRFGV